MGKIYVQSIESILGQLPQQDNCPNKNTPDSNMDTSKDFKSVFKEKLESSKESEEDK